MPYLGISRKDVSRALMISAILILLIALEIKTFIVQAQVTLPREQTLVIAYAGSNPTLCWNPFAGGVVGIDDAMRHLSYIPTAALNGYNLTWTFLLAQSLTFDGQNIVARVKIWDNAKWSDGTPITVKDIIGSFNLSRQIGGGWWGDWNVYNYVAVDDKTFEYYIGRRPGQDMPKRESIRSVVQGGVIYVRPLPYHVLKAKVDEMGDAMKSKWCNDKPDEQVVSGPYKLYYFDSTQIIYQRIDNWWGKDIFGLPAPKYIKFVYYRDAQTAVAALQSGDVDVYLGYAPRPQDLIAAGIGTWYKKSPYFLSSGAVWLFFNFNYSIFQPIEVRRAIAWAMPWDQIVNYAALGLTVQPSMTGLNDQYPFLRDFINTDACKEYWGTPTCRPAQNLTKAKQILDSAGIVDRDKDGIRELPDGTKLKFTIAVPATYTTYVIAAQLIANALNQIGMKVDVDTQDYRVWDQNRRAGKLMATLGNAGGGIGTATPFTDMYGNAFEYNNYKQWALWFNYRDDDVTSFISEMNFNYMFPDQLKDVVKTFQEVILFDRLPAIPVMYDIVYYMYNTKYWDGFPNAERAWWYIPCWWGETFFYFLIVPKGQTPQMPWYLKHISKGGATIHGWYDFYKAQGLAIRNATSTTWTVVPSSPTTTTPVTSPTTPVTTATTTTPPTSSPATTTPPATSPSPTQTQTVATPTPTVTVTATIERSVTVPSTVTVLSTKITTIVSASPTTIAQTNWTMTTVLAVVLLAVGIAIGWTIKRK
ncbi:MAG: ABC transporter substrate-binding protein [Ignisphaera sp.]